MRTLIKAQITLMTLIMIAFASAFSVTAFSVTAEAAAPTSKREMIERLKKLKETQASELAILESAIRKQLQESMNLSVAKEEVRFATAKAGMLTKKLDELNTRRSELNARREMIDRLIFAVDSKYSNQPIQQFLEQQFLEMASTDLSESRDSRMWKAFTYFSIAMREVPETREDMFDVIEGYMNFSSVLDPKTPAEFLASRNYTNGVQSVAARPALKESVGDDLDMDEASGKGRAASSTGTMALELNLPSKFAPRSASVQTASTSTSIKTDTVSGTTQSASPTTAPAADTSSAASAITN